MPSATTVAWSVIVAVLVALNGIQVYQREARHRLRGEVEKWKAAADAGATTVQFAQSELGLVRERCGGLESSVKTLTEENAALRARTDLDSLSKALNNEGRWAQEAHEAILHGLENLAGSVSEMTKRIIEMTEQANTRDQQYAMLISSQSELIKSLQSQMNLKEALRRTA